MAESSRKRVNSSAIRCNWCRRTVGLERIDLLGIMNSASKLPHVHYWRGLLLPGPHPTERGLRVISS